MNTWSGLLFLQGHITNPRLARSLAEEAPPPESRSTPPPSAERRVVHPGPACSMRYGWTATSDRRT